MRVVLYFDADMEPITVLDLPQTLLKLGAEQGRVQLHVPEPPVLITSWQGEDPSPALNPPSKVSIDFERFHRKGRLHYFLTTSDDVLALRLRPAWLPGQQSMVNDYAKQVSALTEMLMAALIRSLR